MSLANFVYEAPDADAEPRGAFRAGVYSARPATAAMIHEAASAAGVVLLDYDLLAELDDSPPPLPADVLLVDCPVQDGATLAALACLDMRAAREGTRLIVSTTLSALDTVFGCLDQSRAQLLVEPTRGERVIALGRSLAKGLPMGVRELSEDDRVTLLRLTEQVGQIAAQLDRLSAGDGPSFRLESPADEFHGEGGNERRLLRTPRPPLPDPRLVRLIIRQRQLRNQFVDPELFADPAWDILLDLTAARAEHQRVSVTSLCIASGVPPTTALRWISQMVEAGLLERIEDETDRRRAFIQLSDKAADAMARYFAELGKDAKSLI
jgi:DNA-binding MarR family transcriptional regulator